MFSSRQYSVTEQEYELVEYVMRRIPVRAHMLGRATVAAVVSDIVLQWPTENAGTLKKGPEDAKRALASLEGRLRSSPRSGFMIPILLSAVLSTLIKLVLEWWLSGKDKQWAMAAWQNRMRQIT